MVWIVVPSFKCKVLIGVVYRPPNADISILESLHDFLYVHSKHYTHIILCGDFNLPMINWDDLCVRHSCQHAEMLLDLAFSFNLKQVVGTPTRVTSSSKTILDLVLISEAVSETGFTVEVLPGISDHEAILFKSNLQQNIIRCPDKEVLDFGRAADESLIDYLEQDFDIFLKNQIKV